MPVVCRSQPTAGGSGSNKDQKKVVNNQAKKKKNADSDVSAQTHLYVQLSAEHSVLPQDEDTESKKQMHKAAAEKKAMQDKLAKKK